MGGSIISWTSKAQNHTTLSSSEAEYAALATAGQELVFVNNIINDIGVAVQPGLILGDNEGAMHLLRTDNLEPGLGTLISNTIS